MRSRWRSRRLSASVSPPFHTAASKLSVSKPEMETKLYAPYATKLREKKVQTKIFQGGDAIAVIVLERDGSDHRPNGLLSDSIHGSGRRVDTGQDALKPFVGQGGNSVVSIQNPEGSSRMERMLE